MARDRAMSKSPMPVNKKGQLATGWVSGPDKSGILKNVFLVKTAIQVNRMIAKPRSATVVVDKKARMLFRKFFEFSAHRPEAGGGFCAPAEFCASIGKSATIILQKCIEVPRQAKRPYSPVQGPGATGSRMKRVRGYRAFGGIWAERPDKLVVFP